jgi:hypothetical protein
MSNYKTNRQNHDFQILHFIVGSCHTPDAMYAILHDLRDDREMALKSYEAGQLKKKIKIMKAEALIESGSMIEKLEGQAELAEIYSMEELEIRNYKAALDELAFIDKCIARVQPYRKYANLTDAEAHEAAQQEEWKLELMHRAENMLLTAGNIATDQFATMRMHPEFETAILPHIDTVKQLMIANEPAKLFLKLKENTFDLPKLLETK